MECVFCTNQDIRQRVIMKNDVAWAFLTNIPITPGHTLVCPRRCITTMEELTVEEWNALREMIARMKEVLRGAFGATGFHCVWNEGVVAGQSVPHLHVHVVPRQQGDAGITEYDPRKFLYRPGVRPTSPEEELQEVAKVIRDALQ